MPENQPHDTGTGGGPRKWPGRAGGRGLDVAAEPAGGSAGPSTGAGCPRPPRATAAGVLGWGRPSAGAAGARQRPRARAQECHSYEGRAVGQLLLRAIDALKRENDRLGSVNRQFKASCEGQRPPWTHSKRNSFPASGAERVWRLNTLKAEFSGRWSPSPSWGLTGRERALRWGVSG